MLKPVLTNNVFTVKFPQASSPQDDLALLPQENWTLINSHSAPGTWNDFACSSLPFQQQDTSHLIETSGILHSTNEIKKDNQWKFDLTSAAEKNLSYIQGSSVEAEGKLLFRAASGNLDDIDYYLNTPFGRLFLPLIRGGVYFSSDELQHQSSFLEYIFKGDVSADLSDAEIRDQLKTIASFCVATGNFFKLASNLGASYLYKKINEDENKTKQMQKEMKDLLAEKKWWKSFYSITEKTSYLLGPVACLVGAGLYPTTPDVASLIIYGGAASVAFNQVNIFRTVFSSVFAKSKTTQKQNVQKTSTKDSSSNDALKKVTKGNQLRAQFYLGEKGNFIAGPALCTVGAAIYATNPQLGEAAIGFGTALVGLSHLNILGSAAATLYGNIPFIGAKILEANELGVVKEVTQSLLMNLNKAVFAISTYIMLGAALTQMSDLQVAADSNIANSIFALPYNIFMHANWDLPNEIKILTGTMLLIPTVLGFSLNLFYLKQDKIKALLEKHIPDSYLDRWKLTDKELETLDTKLKNDKNPEAKPEEKLTASEKREFMARKVFTMLMSDNQNIDPTYHWIDLVFGSSYIAGAYFGASIETTPISYFFNSIGAIGYNVQTIYKHWDRVKQFPQYSKDYVRNKLFKKKHTA